MDDDAPSPKMDDTKMMNIKAAQALRDLASQMLYPDERSLPGFEEIAEQLEDAATRLAALQSAMTHAWCENCQKVQRATQHPFVMPSVNGLTLGGDITCDSCHFIIATTGVVQDGR